MNDIHHYLLASTPSIHAFLFVVALVIVLLISTVGVLRKLRRAEKQARAFLIRNSLSRGEDSSLDSDPFEALQQISLEEKEQRKKFEHILRDFEPVLMENSLLYALNAEPYTEVPEDSVREILARMHITEHSSDQYAVLLVRIEAISTLKLDLHRNVYSNFRTVLQFSCSESIPTAYESHFVWTDHSLLAGVVLFPGSFSQEQIYADMNEISIRLQEQMTLLSEAAVIIAFSDIAASSSALPTCYLHAKELLQHKIFYQTDTPYTYRQLVEQSVQLSYEQRQHILEQIMAGKTHGPVELLESYFTALHNNPETKLENVKSIGLSISESILSAVNESSSAIDNDFEDTSLYDDLRNAQTVHDVADRVVSFAKDAASYMHEKLQNKKNSRIKEAIEWIDNNYNRDISLDDIAVKMGLSTTYASKQLHAYTGMSISEYINKVRIDHAKLLLANTKTSCAEIGEKVGFRHPQSFVRAFKNYTGMTPGTYRTISTEYRSE